LTILKKMLGPDHPDVAVSLTNLAGVYFLQEKYAQAEPLFQEALLILEKATPNHPNHISALRNLAAFYEKTGREDEAKRLLERAKRVQAGQ